MADLPSNIKYGTIRGRFLRAILDSDDGDQNPDGVPIPGLTITFRPDIDPALVLAPTAVPPTTIQVDPIIVTTDDEGYIYNPADNARFVKLIASSSTQIQPSGWSWAVSIDGVDFPGRYFSFILGEDQNLDLTSAVEVPPNPGAVLDAWRQAVADTLANANRSQTEADRSYAAADDADASADFASAEADRAAVAAQNALGLAVLPVGQAIPANWPTRLVVRTEA